MSALRAWLAGALVACIALPFALLVMLSLARGWRYPTLLPDAWQLDQWRELAATAHALAALALRSALLALTVGALATGAGFLTSRALRAERRLLALAALPFAISPLVFALCLGQAFAWAGLAASYGAVLAAQLPLAYGYAVLLTRVYWSPHTLALEAAAAALGADGWRLWRAVHVPLARGLLGVCLFQTALISWFDFAIVRGVGAGRVRTLTLAVFDDFSAGDLRQAAAAALVLLAPPALALFLRPRALLPAPLREAGA